MASPKGLEEYKLEPFDVGSVLANVQAGLDEIPFDVLADVPGAAGPPTLDALCAQITNGHYTLLHAVAHGKYQKETKDTVLYLARPAASGRDDKQADPVPGRRLVERLGQLNEAHGLPHFIFLASCESAHLEAEANLGSRRSAWCASWAFRPWSP